MNGIFMNLLPQSETEYGTFVISEVTTLNDSHQYLHCYLLKGMKVCISYR